jgi:hypothetical protein
MRKGTEHGGNTQSNFELLICREIFEKGQNGGLGGIFCR